jgi:hypothetical protein
MFVVLWEFEVKPVNLQRFENAHSPAGAWAQLFRRDPHYRGTQLLQDPSRGSFHFTLDFWDSQIAYRDFLTANRQAYEELDKLLNDITVAERHIVSFKISPSNEGTA